MVSDLFTSVRAALYDRISSPLSGAFLISWFIWNYKTILVLFSSLAVGDKISAVESLYSRFLLDLVGHGFVFPFLSAVVFIIVYPYPSKWLYQYWRRQQRDIKEIKQRIDDETPLTLDESRSIRRDVRSLEARHDEELKRKDAEIVRLKELLEEMQSSEPQDGKKGTDDSSPSGVAVLNRFGERQQLGRYLDSVKPPDERQEQVIKYLAENEGKVGDQDFYRGIGFNRIRAECLVSDLISKGYVAQGFDVKLRHNAIWLTDEGKRYAVKKGFVD